MGVGWVMCFGCMMKGRQNSHDKEGEEEMLRTQVTALRSPFGLIEMYNTVAERNANCQDNSFVCTWRVNR